MTYQVAHWNEHFENNKSRERDQCSYVCVPNKQHGMGLSRILSEPDGAAIYGIWHLIVGAVSRQKRPRDGWLTDDGHQTGTAWAPSDLAVLWRRTEPEIARALAVLCSHRVGWVARHDDASSAEQVVDTEPQALGARQVPAKCPPDAPELNRREGKGIESKSAGANGDWIERIRNAYPSKTHQDAARAAISASLNQGHAPEVMLQGVRECASAINAAESVAGGALRWVPNPENFFTDGSWQEPQRFAAKLKPKNSGASRPKPDKEIFVA